MESRRATPQERRERAELDARFGKIALTTQRVRDHKIPDPPPFRPDQKPSDLREGMDFHFTLDVRP